MSRRWLLSVGALVRALVTLAAPNVASAASVLPAGATMTATQSIVSPNGEYTLVMQADGNLVEYLTGGRRSGPAALMATRARTRSCRPTAIWRSWTPAAP